MLHGLKEAAHEYWLQGFNVVAVAIERGDDGRFSKKPLVDWGRWQKERQSPEDFDGQPWDSADGFGVVCSIPNREGYYLAVVDHDTKNVSVEARRRGEELLKRFPTTRMERTVSGGRHLVYYSRVKPKPVSLYHESHALELIAGPKLCIMAPSKGYMRLNDNSPTVIEDAEALFYEVLGVGDGRVDSSRGLPADKLEKWLQQVKRHLHVTGEGSQYIYAHCPFHPPDKHPSLALHKTKFYAVDYHDGRVYSLRQLAEALGISLEGVNETLNISLGGYRLNVMGRDVFLHNSLGEPVFTCKLYALNTQKTKAKISELTGVDEADVERKVAAFVFRVHVMEKDGIEGNCENELDGEADETLVFDVETEAKIEAEVKRIIEAENQLEALKPHLDVVVVGEDENKLAILTLLAGSKFQEAEKKQIILLKGTEGGGKTTLASTLTGFFRTKMVGRFTEHALEYSDLKGYEVLYIQELGSMDMEKQGVATIKFLSADDKGFIVEFTVRDREDGRLRTEQKRIPAITTISTTTRLILDSQFERRAWLFNVDESIEQTERVKKWKAWLGRQRDEVKLGIRKITDYDFSREVIKRFVQQLKPEKIVIPFRETLTQVLGSNALRVRGDIDKLYSFIELYALFNPKRLLKVKEDVYAVTPEIAVEALKIVEKPLANMLCKADERVWPLLQALKEVVDIKEETDDYGQNREKPVKFDKRGSQIDKKVREKLAIKLGKSEKTVRELLNFLEASGYVCGDQKKPKTYTLLYDVTDIESKLVGVSAILKTANSLMEKMLKEAREWLRIELETQPPQEGEENKIQGSLDLDKASPPPTTMASFKSPENGLSKASLGKISQENHELEKPPQKEENSIKNGVHETSDLNRASSLLSFTTQPPISNPIIGMFKASSDGKTSENRQFSESPIPRGFLKCEFCAKNGRTMLFASKQDLDLHVKARHRHDGGC